MSRATKLLETNASKLLRKRRFVTKELLVRNIKPKLAYSRLAVGLAVGLAKIKVEKIRLPIKNIDLTNPLPLINISIKEEAVTP